MVSVLYLTLLERKVIWSMHGRIGPNRVGPRGIGQPFADAIKMFSKEVVIPSTANYLVYIAAPVISLVPALSAWSMIPFSENSILSDTDMNILAIFALTSLGVYGIMLSGWASNSKYPFLGSLRSAAQIVSYEIAIGLVFIGVFLISDSGNLSKIVMSQSGGFWNWYFIPLFPMVIVYWIASVAETNRAPFDVAEGESEIVGFHAEYSGIGFALFFLAEYANMMLVSTIASLIFFGGWLSPFEGIPFLSGTLSFVPGIFWLAIKVSFFIFLFFWMRATFPRYRYDQIMRLGWKFLIPIAFAWLILVAISVKTCVGIYLQTLLSLIYKKYFLISYY